jgi:hypothetical protein
MINNQISAKTEAKLLDYIETLTDSREQYASNLTDGIHNCVILGRIVEVEATEEAEAVLSERYHADIHATHELDLPSGIQRHFPDNPRHRFA